MRQGSKGTGGKWKSKPVRVEGARRKAQPEGGRSSRAPALQSNAGLPAADEAPRGASVIDARGGFAVALSINGRYLGIFRR
jgi:hypothetical protein